MTDDDTLLLNAYLDGELSPSETIAMERRLAAESELRSEFEALKRMSGSVKSVLASDRGAEEALRSRVVAAIGLNDNAPASTSRRQLLPAAAAASLVLGLGLGYLASNFFKASLADSAGISNMILAAHLRGLAAAQPFDVASSDRHVVKPWFNGRTTLAPKAPDLSADGFPLAGGRIDVVGEETVPTLVYKRRRHVISLTALPPASRLAPGEETKGGTNIVRWDAGNLVYIAVSDLNLPELRTFVDRFRAAP